MHFLIQKTSTTTISAKNNINNVSECCDAGHYLTARLAIASTHPSSYDINTGTKYKSTGKPIEKW
jgi:hypothetical protein